MSEDFNFYTHNSQTEIEYFSKNNYNKNEKGNFIFNLCLCLSFHKTSADYACPHSCLLRELGKLVVNCKQLFE